MSLAVHFPRPDPFAARDAAWAPVVGHEPEMRTRRFSGICERVCVRARAIVEKKFTACVEKFSVD